MTRVLILSAHTGHLDRRVISEANAVAASGRDVTLLSVPTMIPERCLDERIEVIMPDVEGEIVASPPRSSVRELLGHLGRNYFPYPVFATLKSVMSVLSKSTADPFHLDLFLRYAPSSEFDIIHCHDLDTLPAACALRRDRAMCARIVYDAHELFPFQSNEHNVQRYWSEVEAKYIHRADAIVTVNESIASQLSSRYDVAKPTVIYNSWGSLFQTSDTSEAEFLKHFAAPQGGFRVIYQGNFFADRNLENLVRAFGHLDNTTRLFLLGGGPVEPSLRAICHDSGIGNVFFGQWIPQGELLNYTRHAHLGVIPYQASGLNKLYCTPNKLFEFIEVNLPICTADLPELRRVVKGYGIGDVYDMSAPKSIAHAIDDCRERCLAGEFDGSTHTAARETLGWDSQEKVLLKLYEQLEV